MYLIAFDKIIIELKAIDTITSREESKLLNYLQAAKLKLGLIINFGSDLKLERKRSSTENPCSSVGYIQHDI